MNGNERWAALAAALPTAAREAREAPFWQELAAAWGWHRVVDAGCGAGFHVGLLTRIGIETVGFDLSLAAVRRGQRGSMAVGDVVAPPIAAGSVDGALCLGNTISLLPSRAAQRQALCMLAPLLRPGGVLLLQGEDVGALVSDGPRIRTRALEDGSTHVRVFRRRGARVEMLAAVVGPGEDAAPEITSMLPTSPDTLREGARLAGLLAFDLPLATPGGPSTSWWLALRRRFS